MAQRTRRSFMSDSLSFSTTMALGWLGSPVFIGDDVLAAFEPPLADPFTRGQRVGTLLFNDQKRQSAQHDVVHGKGLSGRLRCDLSTLTQDALVTPNDRFFIRTRCPDNIDYDQPWKIRVHGLVERPVEIAVDEIVAQQQPMGVHLLECSGSGLGGLISTAHWSGVPIVDVLQRVNASSEATRVRISGFDDHSQFDSDFDERGADWIFTFEQLAKTGAFLATQMNGVELSEDHGFPVRLVVPGWYGCTCVKWLDEIEFVDDTAKATRHMCHFARRTHQRGRPRLARNFTPAEIDLAAMPVRVEQWRVGDQLVYRVVGILWGGKHTTDALAIRFNDDQDYAPVSDCVHETTRTWTLWSHVWRPKSRGEYVIRLRVDDQAICTRRLDQGRYQRIVRIEEVSA